jgi:hypothetical protein
MSIRARISIDLDREDHFEAFAADALAAEALAADAPLAGAAVIDAAVAEDRLALAAAAA